MATIIESALVILALVAGISPLIAIVAIEARGMKETER